MIRRRKIQVRPNMASAAVSSVASNSAQNVEAPAGSGSIDSSQQIAQQDLADPVQQQIEQEEQANSELVEQQQVMDVNMNVTNHENEERAPETNGSISNEEQDLELEHGQSLHESAKQDQLAPPRMERRQLSLKPSLQSQISENEGIPEKKRRETLKDKLCDTKKFTMADLVSWKPKTENSLKKKWSERRKMFKDLEEDNEEGSSQCGSVSSGTVQDQSQQSAGPRVKINANGQMVIDEESLVVDMGNADKTNWETVNDDLMPKKLTSMSFKKRIYKRGTVWSVLETDLFYEVLAATGTDFGLMHEFIPSRTRVELKQKFNREQRNNSYRIDETFKNPVLLDERLRIRVERMLQQIANKS